MKNWLWPSRVLRSWLPKYFVLLPLAETSSFLTTLKETLQVLPGDAQVEKDYVDISIKSVESKIEASEAKTRELITSMRSDMDNQFERISGALAIVQQKIVPFWKFAVTVIGSAVTAVGVIIAIMAYGGDRFDGGWAASSTYANQIEAQKTETEKRFDSLDNQISLIAASLTDKSDEGEKKPDVEEPEASKE